MGDPLLERLGRVNRDLHALGAVPALVGGLAVGVRTEPRFTKDVDLVLAVADDASAEGLIHELHALGYVSMLLLEHEVTGRLSTVRCRLPNSDAAQPQVDLLFASSGIEPEIVAEAEPTEVPGAGLILVACTGHLIAMKVLAQSETRLQDTLDLQRLLRTGTVEDLQLARDSLALITERGFDRGKDLGAELDGVLRTLDRRPGGE